MYSCYEEMDFFHGIFSFFISYFIWVKLQINVFKLERYIKGSCPYQGLYIEEEGLKLLNIISQTW